MCGNMDGDFFLILYYLTIDCSALYLICDVFILPLTSTDASVGGDWGVLDDIQGQEVDFQATHTHYLLSHR